MYTLVSTYLKPKGLSQTYGPYDISLQTLRTIKSTYIDGYIELANVALTDNIFVTIDEFRELNLPMRDNHTFEYWLRYIGNKTIPGVEIRPDYITREVKSRNVLHAGYKVDLCKRTQAPNNTLAIGDMNDVYLRKENVDVNILRTRSLTTVNGFFHPHVPYYDGVAIVGGGSQCKYLGKLQVGLWSFSGIGDVQMIPIKEDMIHRFKTGVLLANKAIVDMNTDIENKSILVFIAGYMLTGTNLVSVMSDVTGVIKIDMRAFDLVRRVTQAHGHINLESAGFTYDPEDSSLTQFSANKILSDVVTKKIMSLPQSFIAIIDTPSLSITRHPIAKTGLIDRRISITEPNLPIIDSCGRCPEYWIQSQNTAYSIHLPHSYYEKHLHETRKQFTYDRFNTAIEVDGFQEHNYQFLKLISVKLA